MDGDLRNANDALQYIEEKAVRTSQGSFVRVDDVREAMSKVGEAKLEEALRPRPRTFDEARRMVYRDEGLMELFRNDRMPPPGASVPAMETQPPRGR